jgi:hypothetical protein
VKEIQQAKDKEREDDEKSVESAKNKSTELTETVVPAEVMTVEEEKKVKKKATSKGKEKKNESKFVYFQ